MRQLHKLLVVSLLLLLFAGTSFADEMIFDAVQDAFTSFETPNTPCGLGPIFLIGAVFTVDPNIGWIEFDLDELPHGTVIDQVDLVLTLQHGEPSIEFDVRICDFPWDEATITYDNQPNIGAEMTTWSGDASGETIVIPIPPIYGWMWMEGADVTHGMCLMHPEPEFDNFLAVYSNQHTTQPGPKLHVTYHVLPPAVIELTPPEMAMGFAYGDPEIGDGVVDGSFTIQNTGERELVWSLTDDVDWMSCAPLADNLDPGESQSVDIWIDEWPGAGTQVGTITISDPNADPPSADVTVTVNFHQAQLAVDPGAVDLIWNSYDPEIAGSFEVQNPGDLPLNWSLTESADWMSCSPVSGTVAAGNSETVTITCDTWPGEGVFNDLITITDENAEPFEVMVDVTLTCVDIDMTLTLFPPTDPVVIAPGGSFDYDLQLDSWLDVLTYTDFLAKAVLPNGNSITITTVMNVPVQPNATLYVEGLTQSVPVTAPAGDYVFRVLAGVFPTQLLAMDSFGVTVEGAALSGGATDWSADGFGETLSSYQSEPAVGVVADAVIPSEFALGQAYPNPFNPSTTLTVNLPEATELKVDVYNVAGQHVATLANSNYVAGSYTLTFDASHLSGGVYFVQATAGSWNDVQKVVLMK
jgi:Secretion system C-terminal sorting domain/Viral BACON domain